MTTVLENSPILFHSEDISFSLDNEQVITAWIQAVIHTHQHQLRQLNYIFCSDEYLHRINVEYLQHDTYTDIITFPYSASPFIESDIFISIDRVRENANLFKTTFKHELYRVMIHGVLHLCGFGDKTAKEKTQMRTLEEQSIEQLNANNSLKT